MFVVEKSASSETSVLSLSKSTPFYHHKAGIFSVNSVTISNPTEPNHFRLNLRQIPSHSIVENTPSGMISIKSKKGKVFPLQDRCGPEGG